MSVLDLRARHIVLETLIDQFLEDNYGQEQNEDLAMQMLHDSLDITWDAAEQLAAKLVPELWIDADDIAQQEMRETQEMLDTIDDALRGCYGWR